jgi:hypothetical protein
MVLVLSGTPAWKSHNFVRPKSWIDCGRASTNYEMEQCVPEVYQPHELNTGLSEKLGGTA